MPYATVAQLQHNCCAKVDTRHCWRLRDYAHVRVNDTATATRLLCRWHPSTLRRCLYCWATVAVQQLYM